MVHVALVAVLVAAVAVAEEEAAVASAEDFGSDDGLVDAIRDRQALADQAAQTQIPSVVVHVAAFAEVDLVEVIRPLVDKDPCSHQTAAVGVAEPVVVGVHAAAAAAADVDDVAAAELVVVQQSIHRAVTYIEHGLRQHDGVLQLAPLARELYLRLLLLYDVPTIQPCSSTVSHCVGFYA